MLRWDDLSLCAPATQRFSEGVGGAGAEAETEAASAIIILQPCPAQFRDCQCSIYNDRPERLPKLFECKQLQRVSTGEISESEAAAKIQEARERVNRILTLFELAGETNSKGPMAIRYEKILAVPLDSAAGEVAVVRARLILEMGEFGSAHRDAIFDRLRVEREDK